MNSKRFVLIASLTLLALIGILFIYDSPVSFTHNLNAPSLQASFTALSNANSDVCIFGINETENFLDSMPYGSYIQGSCCNYMDYNAYAKQINGLKQYSNFSEIPPDPYNVSVALVKQMVSYWNATLTANQNATLTKTLAITSQMGGDNGYCCCECWAWYFHEGLLKYLILNYNLSAGTLGNILYLEDCCGGPLGSAGFNA
ncbi:MAG: hypothetical protein BJBARM4_0917 [Candidatus Parvarchaeum acidiphilum ARMAN-4]|jgi:hypothetical protein|uniref:Uncharacterized protein n=1 Tax=Candidatus Parvarchaeum acidiphilum ARMAN-4 TaxID=662760 RepID=D2EGL8_PARA4|nr:MAG: hypothetical protein BJBARM4_0917 [Candidatus Parvarchaeum acidiphilum ARMAN-4]